MMGLQRNGIGVGEQAQMSFSLLCLSQEQTLEVSGNRAGFIKLAFFVSLFYLFKWTELLLNIDQQWIWSFLALKALKTLGAG